MTAEEARTKGYDLPTAHPTRQILSHKDSSGKRICDNCTMVFHPAGVCTGCKACGSKIDGFRPGRLSSQAEKEIEVHRQNCPNQFKDKCLRCLRPGHSAYTCDVLFCVFCWKKCRDSCSHWEYLADRPPPKLPWIHITDVRKCRPDLQWGPKAVSTVVGEAFARSGSGHGSQDSKQQSARRYKKYATNQEADAVDSTAAVYNG